MTPIKKRLKILTWHVHGNYMYYLSHVAHDFYLVTRPAHPPGYAGRIGDLPWPANVHEIAEDRVPKAEFDCVLFQSQANYDEDRHTVLSAAQRRLPAVYLEHDPPRQHPVDAVHYVQDPNVMLVHVTPFNALMWDSGITPHRVVEHGVTVSDHVAWRGDVERGIVVINNLGQRGRRLGADVFEHFRERVPLDLFGIGSEAMGGAGEIPNTEFAARCAPYRFFFNPIRYTSLGLSVVEAMMIGMPVVGLATTELATVIRNGENGWIDTRLETVEEAMHMLLDNYELAQKLGENARTTALERFNIKRFVVDWMAVFAEIT